MSLGGDFWHRFSSYSMTNTVLPDIIWFLVAEYLQISDLLSLTSTCHSNLILLRGYTLPRRERILLGLGARAWLRRSQINTGPNLSIVTPHTSHISYLCLTYEGLLAAASHDGSVSLWDPNRNWMYVGRWIAHEGPVRCICALPDSRLVTASGGILKVTILCPWYSFGSFLSPS